MLYTQFIINGLIAGAIVGLYAIGFAIIYQTNRFAHFAHGAVVVLGGYFLYTFFELVGLNFYFSAVLAILATSFVGPLMYLVVYKPLKKRGASNAILLITSIALMIFLENLALFIFGAGVKSIDMFGPQKVLEFGSGVITPIQIILIITSALVLAGLWLFVKYSSLGKIMRAVADNPELAKITGVNTDRIAILGFWMGSLIAGIAAILITLEFNISPSMGTNFAVRGFAAAVIGGIQSIPGAAIGGYVLGLAENIGIIWLPSGYKEAVGFILLIVFLLFRPQGILGINKGTRK